MKFFLEGNKVNTREGMKGNLWHLEMPHFEGKL